MNRRCLQADLDRRADLELRLHQDVQQPLLAVAAGIGAAAVDASPASRALLDRAARQIHDALRHLRDLARLLHPAFLLSDGLAAAVQSTAERLLLDVRIDIGDVRLPAHVEAVAHDLVRDLLVEACERGVPGVHLVGASRDTGVALSLLVGGPGLTSDAVALVAARDVVVALGGAVTSTGRAGVVDRVEIVLPHDAHGIDDGPRPRG